MVGGLLRWLGVRGGTWAGAGRQGVKAVGGQPMAGGHTCTQAGAAGGAQVRSLRCLPVEKEEGRVEARAVVDSWA